MSFSLNKVQIIGNCGQDPEIRSFDNGGKIATITIATSQQWKDKNTGEKKERTEWHRVVFQGDKLVDIIEKNVKKGIKIFIEGELRNRKWTDKDGVERYATDIVVNVGGDFIIFGAKSEGNSDKAVREKNTPPAEASIDDEIPF